MTIGERLRTLRKEKGLTQKELAERLGVSASMVGQYETNVRSPKMETLKKFANSLNIDISEIIDISNVSPSLNKAVPLVSKFNDILDRTSPGNDIIFSDEERKQIAELVDLMGNVPDEISSSSFLSNVLKKEYLLLFDKLNLRGKYCAVKMVSDLAEDPELNGKQYAK